MTRTVDDIIDIALGVLMTAMMLAMGFWCQLYLVNLYAQPVIEKTAPTVQSDALYMEHAVTGKDCLLELVINDAYCPKPNKVVFQKCWAPGADGAYAIEYNSAWYSTKEDNINKAWRQFFNSASASGFKPVDCPRTTSALVYKADGVTPDHWLITLHTSEKEETCACHP